MEKFKINKNKPELTDEEIDKHKDFDKLLNNYKDIYSYKKATQPLYKNTRLRLFVMLVLAVLLAIFYGEKEKQSSKEGAPVEDSENIKPVAPDSLNKSSTIEDSEVLYCKEMLALQQEEY
ncbi:hypothetical protein RCC89_09610 [Cytophagaceae bacterium ABcell3]|nr:hypothetical protein RCC89_09610 [Cytophagaceae bacterium ABcell3]